jgi:hypothetical protein
MLVTHARHQRVIEHRGDTGCLREWACRASLAAIMRAITERRVCRVMRNLMLPLIAGCVLRL